MLITVQIGTSSFDWRRGMNDEIQKSLREQRDGGKEVCVRILIDHAGWKLSIRTACCPASGGGSGRLNEEQERILELWRKHGLDVGCSFPPGHLIAFLSQLTP